MEWRTLSLKKRCVLIERQFGVKISDDTLLSTYKSLGVKYLRPLRSLDTCLTEQEIVYNRLRFFTKLHTRIK